MNICLIGAGYMAKEYVKIFNHLSLNYKIIGRTKKCTEQITGVKNDKRVLFGGVERNNFALKNCERIINAVDIGNIYKTTVMLLENGYNNILLEKPAFTNPEEYEFILTKYASKNIYVAYNRRYYRNADYLLKYFSEHGNPSSAHFEFTERILQIQKNPSNRKYFSDWLLANSSHVIDLGFFLIGQPKEISAESAKVDGLSLNENTKNLYYGMGKTLKNVYFTYHSNWSSSGNWNIKIMHKNGLFVLNPLETLKFQPLGHNAGKKVMEEVTPGKPGLLNLVQDFVRKKPSSKLPNLQMQSEFLSLINKIKDGSNQTDTF